MTEDLNCDLRGKWIEGVVEMTVSWLLYTGGLRSLLDLFGADGFDTFLKVSTEITQNLVVSKLFQSNDTCVRSFFYPDLKKEDYLYSLSYSQFSAGRYGSTIMLQFF